MTVGGADDLMVDVLYGIRPTWTGPQRRESWRGFVQIRAHGEPLPATIETAGERIVMRLDAGTRGVAPGQYAVSYDGDRVVGSSIISATERSAAEVAR